jgi:RNA polymerase sigma-70 factor (ECF subfamily)
MRIAVNEAISRARRRGRYESFDARTTGMETVAPMPTANNNPERQAFVHEMKGILESAIDTLPDGLREVFMLREVEGLSTGETTQSLEVSDDVVRTWLSRARAALRRELFDRVGATAAQSFTFLRPRCDRLVAAVLARIG